MTIYSIMKMIFHTKDTNNSRPKPNYARVFNTGEATQVKYKGLNLKEPYPNISKITISPLTVNPDFTATSNILRTSMIERVMSAKSGCSACGK